MSKIYTKSRINIERNHLRTLILMLFAASASGYITFFYHEIPTSIQITYLAHTFLGIALSLILFVYIKNHFIRVISTRQFTSIATGLISLTTISITSLSGIHISIFGQSESSNWIISTHIYSSLLAISLIVIHVAIYLATRPTIQNTLSRPNTLPDGTSIYIFKNSLYTVIFIAFLSILYDAATTPPVNEAKIDPYDRSYGANPFRPSQVVTDNNDFINPSYSGRSDRCGTCHTEITKQWQSSMHSQAASDKAYQTNINLLAINKGMASTRYCEGCHAPVALMGGQLTKGGKLDTAWHLKEGVSCMACHGIKAVTHLKGNASYYFEESDNYLFNNSDSILLTKIHNYLINIQPRDHKTQMARPLEKDSMLCATCHAQFMDKEINQWGWVKMQDEYNAWLNSSYSGQSKHTFSQTEIYRCQDCHFPLVKSNDPSMNHEGMVRSHRTLGANTAIPWLTGDKEQLDLTTRFLQSDKIRVTIKEPNRDVAMRSRKPINPQITPFHNQPGYFYLNEPATLNVIVTNSNIGHNFPGGTTDISEAWIHLRVEDAQNKLVYENGMLTADGNVDKDAYFYRTIAVDRHGKEVWKHDLFNMTGDSYTNFIPAGESDVVEYNFIIPSWAKAPLQATAVVRYRKFNNRYARWALEDETISLPVTDMARHSRTIPLRMKHEVSQEVDTQPSSY